MPLDPSIPLQASNNALQRRDPMERAARLMQLQQAQQAQQLQQRKVAQQEEQRNMLRQVAALPESEQQAALEQFALQSGDIKGLSSLRKDRREGQKTGMEIGRLQLKMLGQLAGSVRDQSSYEAALTKARAYGMPMDGAPAQYDPQWVKAREMEAMTALERATKEQGAQRLALTARGQNMADARAKNRQGITIAQDSEGRPIVTIGGGAPTMPLERKLKTDLQGDVAKGLETGAELARIRDLFDPELLTYQGRAGTWWNKIKDKAGALDAEGRQKLRLWTKFQNNTEQFFNQYRKEITGAAASVQEMEALKRSMFNTDMGPEEFQAAFGEFQNKALRTHRLKTMLLRDGLPLGGKEFVSRFNALWQTGADDDINARGAELEASGLTDEDVVRRLQEEGYL